MVSPSSSQIFSSLTSFRTSFFLIGFYTLSLICFALIVKFGILRSVNPPGTTLRGMFVLSSFVAGIAGGGISIFFWQTTKYFIGAWGGFAFGLWVQCFRDGGLIRPLGIRWLMFIGMRLTFSLLITSSYSNLSVFCHRFRPLHHSEDSLPGPARRNCHCWRQCRHVGRRLLFYGRA